MRASGSICKSETYRKVPAENSRIQPTNRLIASYPRTALCCWYRMSARNVRMHTTGDVNVNASRCHRWLTPGQARRKEPRPMEAGILCTSTATNMSIPKLLAFPLCYFMDIETKKR